MSNDVDDDPVEAAIERAPWCIIMPTEEFGLGAPDIVGPFATYEEARNWSLSYQDAIIRKMRSPEFEILCRREREEDKAFQRPRN